jgi:hypothetical protein
MQRGYLFQEFYFFLFENALYVFDEFAKSLKHGIIEEISSEIWSNENTFNLLRSSNMKLHL